MMHFSYLGCLVMTHCIWSHDPQWRPRLRVGLENARSDPVEPPFPSGWKNCVRMSRCCMSMVTRVALSDCSVW